MFCAMPGLSGTANSYLFGYRDGNNATSVCSVPGPTIRYDKGVNYNLILFNSLPTGGVKTNIHTHGLNVLGDGNGDDVTRTVNA